MYSIDLYQLWFENQRIAGQSPVGRMILFDLRCAQGHEFEAWFKDGAAFGAQSKAGEISCPVCGGSEIAKAPMAPRLKRRRREEKRAANKVAAAAMHAIKELHCQVEENCDYVGGKFAEEARKIHYGEVEKHGIYGEATDEEARGLEEEEIEFHRLPQLPRHDA